MQVNVNELNDKTLRYLLEADKEAYDHYMHMCADFKQRMLEIEAEIDRRAIEAYWIAHPDLPRLSEGDRLLITDSFVQNREGRGGVDIWRDAQDIKVIALHIDGSQPIASINGEKDNRDIVGVVSMPLDVVIDMRRAYLESVK